MERTVICNAKAIAFGGERQFRHRVIQRAFQRSGPVKKFDTGFNRQLNGILILQIFRSGRNVEDIQEKDGFAIRRQAGRQLFNTKLLAIMFVNFYHRRRQQKRHIGCFRRGINITVIYPGLHQSRRIARIH